MTRSRRRLAALALASAAAVVLGGCGDTDGKASDAPVAPAAKARSTGPVVDQYAERRREAAAARVQTRATRERGAARAVRSYFHAIDEQDFSEAWGRLSSAQQDRNGGYDQWVAGYATTLSNTVTAAAPTATDDAGRHVDVDIKLHAIDVDACTDRTSQRFAGTWRMRLSQGRWRVGSVAMTKTGGAAPHNDLTSCPDTTLADPPVADPSTPTYDDPTPDYSTPDDNTSPSDDYSDQDGTYDGAPTTEDFGTGQGSVGQCADGTYSDSIGRQGACSHHGGVG
jgi:hypothetical protein